MCSRPKRAAAVKAVNAYATMMGGADDLQDSDADEPEEEDEDDFESESDSEGGKRKRKQKKSVVRSRKSPTARPASAKAGRKASDKESATASAKEVVELGSKPVGESFYSKPSFVKKVRRRPPKQPPQPFVDPAGLDIEDRGVEWIVEAQCEKLMPLIIDAMGREELMSHLSMATACSGTDAPVVAMRVVREMLSRRGLDFRFDHVTSCELRP